MKHILIILILVVNLFSCQQRHDINVMITKTRTYSNSDMRLKEIFLKNGNKYLEKNFAYNGWQIYDSTIYNNDSIIVYQPKYDAESRKILKYTLESSKKDTQPKYNNYFRKLLHDKYELSSSYMDIFRSICVSKEIKPNNLESGKVIRTSFIPTILTGYGIPYNELLDSCSYSISANGFLTCDIFFFKNYIIKRSYEYENKSLKIVMISRYDKLNNNTMTNVERYIVDTLQNNNR